MLINYLMVDAHTVFTSFIKMIQNQQDQPEETNKNYSDPVWKEINECGQRLCNELR